MKKAILGALLIAASTVQMVSAAEHHVRRAHHQSDFRGSYNQLSESPYAIPETRAGRNIENFGFRGRTPSRVGGWDPNLNSSRS